MKNKKCKICKYNFNPRMKTQIYCSGLCKYEADKERVRKIPIEKQCAHLNCNNNIITSSNKIYCSKSCGENERYRLNPQKFLLKSKKWQSKNRLKIREWQNSYYQQNINARLSKNLRQRLNGALKNNYKTASAIKDLGCSIEELRVYFENKFKEGMTWENYGSVWHIDHVKPLSKFNLTMREQVLEAVNYTNLQPLFAEENLSKSNNWEQE